MVVTLRKLEHVPHGLKEILDYYGDPDRDGDWDLDPDWYKENTRVFKMPFPLRLSWDHSRSVSYLRFHVKVGDVIVDALEDVVEEHGYDFLRMHDWDLLGSAFHFRRMKGQKFLSTHSWGIAIDLNPETARWGGQPESQPKFIVDAFKIRGFNWGGDWDPEKYTVDPMHFQAATGY